MTSILLTTPRSECGTDRERRVIAALRTKLPKETRLLTTAELWKQATAEAGVWPLHSALPPELHGAERRAVGLTLQRACTGRRRDAYQRLIAGTLRIASALVILPRSDGTAGQGIAAEVATAKRLCAVYVVSPDGQLVPIAEAGMTAMLPHSTFGNAVRFTVWDRADSLDMRRDDRSSGGVRLLEPSANSRNAS
jgi:hypothetical protein